MSTPTYSVAYLVQPGFMLHHITAPMTTFESVGGFGQTPYTACTVSESGGLIASSAGLQVATSAFDEAPQFDIIFVSGGFTLFQTPRSAAAADFIRRQAKGCRHIVGVSSGAFSLASSGLLDGRKALTHWSLSDELAHRFPNVRVVVDEFIVREGPVWTTCTFMGAVEVARHIIAEDLGKDASRRATYEILSYHPRSSQDGEPDGHADRFKTLIRWAREHLGEALSVEQLAAELGMHPRHFIPAFFAATGQTPAKAIERLRLEAAFVFVERTDLPFAEIATRVGFRTAERMRRAFLRTFAVTPQGLRATLSRWPPA